MSLSQLVPGQSLNTPAGPATFLQFKEKNFRDQNYQVEFKTGRKHWYTEAELKKANKQD